MVWLSGPGQPGPAEGMVGDFWYEMGRDLVWQKTAGGWSVVQDVARPPVQLVPGPPGPRGFPGPPGPAGTDGASYTISSLGEVDLAIDDEVGIADTSNSGGNRKIGVERLLGFAAPGLCQGRLTLTSGTAVTTSDVTAAGTIYFTPYNGSRVALYDGTRWNLYTFSEISLALSVSSGTNYDIFLYDNSGTLTLEATAWTNDTTRATAVVLQDGVYVKSGSTTRRYLGTIRGSGANTTEDSVTSRFVWNQYNRIRKKLKKIESTASWTYSSTTWRSFNNSTSNRVEVVCGLAGEWVSLQLSTIARWNGTGTVDNPCIGIALDATNTNDSDTNEYGAGFSSNFTFLITAKLLHATAIGYHFYQATERAYSGVGTVEFRGTETTLLQCGLWGNWPC